MLPYADAIFASWNNKTAGKRRRPTGNENIDPRTAPRHNTPTAVNTPIPTTPIPTVPFVRSDGQLLLRTSINASRIYWPNGPPGFAPGGASATPTDRPVPQPPRSGEEEVPIWDAGCAPQYGDPEASKKIGVAEELRLHFEVRPSHL